MFFDKEIISISGMDRTYEVKEFLKTGNYRIISYRQYKSEGIYDCEEYLIVRSELVVISLFKALGILLGFKNEPK